MGKIKVIKESELIGSTTNDKIYPVTTSEAVHVPELGKLTPHVHPREVMSEDDFNQVLIDGTLKDGYTYFLFNNEEEQIPNHVKQIHNNIVNINEPLIPVLNNIEAFQVLIGHTLDYYLRPGTYHLIFKSPNNDNLENTTVGWLIVSSDTIDADIKRLEQTLYIINNHVQDNTKQPEIHTYSRFGEFTSTVWDNLNNPEFELTEDWGDWEIAEELQEAFYTHNVDSIHSSFEEFLEYAIGESIEGDTLKCGLHIFLNVKNYYSYKAGDAEACTVFITFTQNEALNEYVMSVEINGKTLRYCIWYNSDTETWHIKNLLTTNELYLGRKCNENTEVDWDDPSALWFMDKKYLQDGIYNVVLITSEDFDIHECLTEECLNITDVVDNQQTTNFPITLVTVNDKANDIIHQRLKVNILNNSEYKSRTFERTIESLSLQRVNSLEGFIDRMHYYDEAGETADYLELLAVARSVWKWNEIIENADLTSTEVVNNSAVVRNIGSLDIEDIPQELLQPIGIYSRGTDLNLPDPQTIINRSAQTFYSASNEPSVRHIVRRRQVEGDSSSELESHEFVFNEQSIESLNEWAAVKDDLKYKVVWNAESGTYAADLNPENLVIARAFYNDFMGNSYTDEQLVYILSNSPVAVIDEACKADAVGAYIAMADIIANALENDNVRDILAGESINLNSVDEEDNESTILTRTYGPEKYVTTVEAEDYVVSSTLDNYALTSSLEDYATNLYVNTRLNNMNSAINLIAREVDINNEDPIEIEVTLPITTTESWDFNEFLEGDWFLTPEVAEGFNVAINDLSYNTHKGQMTLIFEDWGPEQEPITCTVLFTLEYYYSKVGSEANTETKFRVVHLYDTVLSQKFKNLDELIPVSSLSKERTYMQVYGLNEDEEYVWSDWKQYFNDGYEHRNVEEEVVKYEESLGIHHISCDIQGPQGFQSLLTFDLQQTETDIVKIQEVRNISITFLGKELLRQGGDLSANILKEGSYRLRDAHVEEAPWGEWILEHPISPIVSLSVTSGTYTWQFISDINNMCEEGTDTILADLEFNDESPVVVTQNYPMERRAFLVNTNNTAFGQILINEVRVEGLFGNTTSGNLYKACRKPDGKTEVNKPYEETYDDFTTAVNYLISTVYNDYIIPPQTITVTPEVSEDVEVFSHVPIILGGTYPTWITITKQWEENVDGKLKFTITAPTTEAGNTVQLTIISNLGMTSTITVNVNSI